MIFSSDAFIFLFLPLWLLAFFSFSAVWRAHINWIVLGASILFYAAWSVSHLPIVLASIIVNYAFVVLLKRSRHTKPVVALGVTFNLAYLGYFKYLCFFQDSFGVVGACDPRTATENLPLAISFFTFQQIAYLVDIHRHNEAGKNIPHPVDYAAFVTFFPHLIAGPITRSNELLKPIEERAYKLSAATLEIGLLVFFIGFFKKVFLADPLGLIVNPIFAAAELGTLDALTASIGVVAFTLQIYFDFSGYSEMAVGLGLMVGIQLPWNFATPYAAASVVDFWRRWHITLSTILRDYLYISLGGNRYGEARKHLNLMATMVLGGLWHGASWTFIAWGALHGTFLIAAHFMRASRLPQAPFWVRVLVTNLAVMFAWIFFRAFTFTGASNLITSFAVPGDFDRAASYLSDFAEYLPFSLNSPGWALASAVSALTIGYCLAITVKTQTLRDRYAAIMASGPSAHRYLVFAGAAVVMSYGLFLQSGAAVEFIYFDF